ncbi:MAG: hypothetical protein AAF628_15730 [Planctomycetota bacterium]
MVAATAGPRAAPTLSWRQRTLPIGGLALLGVATVLLLRNWDGVWSPVMFGEDGTHLFAHYLEHRAPSSILREYAGYISIAPNALGYAIGALPASWQPRVLTWTALLIATLALAMFAGPRFADLIADGRRRAALCVLAATLPYGNFALDQCTMFSLWHLLFALVLHSVAAPPRGWRASLLHCAWALPGAASHPLSLVLAPAWAARCWSARRRGDAPAQMHFALLLGVTLAYPLLCVTPQPGAAASNGGVLAVLWTTFEQLAVRVGAESMLGLRGRTWLAAEGLQALVWIAAVAPIAALAAGWPKLRPPERRAAAVLLGTVVLLTLATVIGRYDELRAVRDWGHRYTYLQRLLLYGVVVAVLGAALRGAPRRARVACAALLVLHAGHLARRNATYYRTQPARGAQLQRFAGDVERWLADPADPRQEMLYSVGRRRIRVRRPPHQTTGATVRPQRSPAHAVPEGR